MLTAQFQASRISGKTEAPAFVNETGIIECMKSWKLMPQGQHVVLFSIGTTGGRNYISIVDSGHNRIKLLLP
jgi:hypothetical protein